MSRGLDARQILETGAAVLVFAAVFLVRARGNPLQRFLKDSHDLVSFGAGISLAYVFLHVLPALDVVRGAYVESTLIPIWYGGRGIYLLALIGFLAFYSVDNVSSRLRRTAGTGPSQLAFRLQVGGFAAYLWLMGYLVLHTLEDTTRSTLLFAVAIAFHLIGVDHDLRRKHGAPYERIGRFVLAGMSLFGWGIGLLITVPKAVLALLVSFVAGAVIMNSAIIELPSGKDVRVRPFLIGGVLYGAILLPLH
jgi:hypothetical protein